MKVALVNDMLVQEGGQERVLRALMELYPKAPIFVLFYDQNKKEKYYQTKEIVPSFLQKFPEIEKRYQWLLPLMPTAIESHDLRAFDLIISSSSSFAKGVLVQPATKHICYCHTPTRYLWSEWHGYVEDLHYPKIIKKILPFYLSHLRNWDYNAGQRVDYFLANSKTVQARVKRYYQKDSTVIYPPVDTENFFIAKNLSNYYLIGGRLVPYKRYDLAVKAFNKLNMPLKIFGMGPEYNYLKSIAKKNIEFLGEVTETEKARLYAESLAFINPQEEDFGITTIEAMSSGRPVIAYDRGGAIETIKAGETGEFFQDQTWEDLANTIIHFQPEKFDSKKIKLHAEQFNKKRFMEEIKSFVDGVFK
ncbi:glycosyl transferase [Candidatus Kuenenbacteria bacterium CG23_combo_of_CG06-09_8_20_14_all_36_9]|nr:MAG: glycosyl transferase [Candidatus Kuenenbacteria bacterium CG23_combo_of_CG06-09_8_20_14_all_36_9]